MMALGQGLMVIPTDGQPVEDDEQLDQQRGSADDGDVDPRHRRNQAVAAQPHEGHHQSQQQAQAERGQRQGNGADDRTRQERAQR